MNLLKGKQIKLKQETIYETTLKNLPFGLALADIKKSEEHIHQKTKEWYFVVNGSGYLYLNGKKILLKENDLVFIPPKIRHFAKKRGIKRFRLLALTAPPWNKKDHYLL